MVLDACVMIPQTLNDLLLTLADAELFQPVWTPDLLDEVERNLIRKLNVPAERAQRRVAQMRTAFPFAEDESRGYRELIPAMTNDPKDRHVLAAAVISGASLIVTANLKDFPKSALEPLGVEAIHPDEFLRDQLALDPAAVLRSMGDQVGRNQRPPQTVGELLTALIPLTPRFVESVRALLPAQDQATSGDESTPQIVSLLELTDEQIELADPALHAWLAHLRTMSPERLVMFDDHRKLVQIAWDFLHPAVRDGDLRSVWSKVDLDLRHSLARKWVQDNHRDIDRNRWNPSEVVNALTSPDPEHPLWHHFERVYVRSFRSVLPPAEHWGIGAEAEIVGPDLEVLYLYDTSALENGWTWRGEVQLVFPLLMRLVDGQWLLRNLGSKEDPVELYSTSR
ncbi:PIN domain-containing protein [Nocardia sp. NPDC005366]|uniref:PIN domain-containing protein n=1 Tax=Nocardia sp. NPDC005366 TaxID=3156878 RepID=UPI0033BED421